MGDEVYRYWGGERLTPEDLRLVLEEDISYRPFWRSMAERETIYSFGEFQVLVSQFELDQVKLAEEHKFENAVNQLREMHESFATMLKDYSFPEYFRRRFQSEGDVNSSSQE